MNFLRTAALVLVAILVPGGLIVLVPALYRFVRDLQARRQKREVRNLVPADGDASV